MEPSYTYSNELTIFSDYETSSFKDILFILKPFVMINGEKKYIVNDRIDSISIKVNDLEWGLFKSLSIDTSHIQKEIINNHILSNMPIKYAVIAPQQPFKDTLTTAGEYSSLLNNFLVLQPGDYICQVEFFDIKLQSNQYQRVYPMISVPLFVLENSKSSFIGEFEIEITY
jgi:hypothetical protein